MFSKKAQGISLNVIIIAAIALIVLVVLIVIFTGRVRIFGTSVTSCASQGGECEDENLNCFTTEEPYEYIGGSGCGCSAGKAIVKGTDCEKTRRICCVSIVEI